MANIKSAKKRIKVIEKKTLRNKMIKSKVKTLIKKLRVAVASKDKDVALSALRTAVVAVEKARAKGVYHRNNASHKVSKMTKAVNGL